MSTAPSARGKSCCPFQKPSWPCIFRITVLDSLVYFCKGFKSGASMSWPGCQGSAMKVTICIWSLPWYGRCSSLVKSGMCSYLK
jgi:hypothetical protein